MVSKGPKLINELRESRQPTSFRYAIIKELIGLAVIVPVVHALGRSAFAKHKPLGYSIVVKAPIYEELICRLVYLNTMKVVQHLLSRSRHLTTSELQSQKRERVWVTGIAFGLSHNHVLSVIDASVGGILLGYAKESTQMTAVPILLHAINNFIAIQDPSYLRLASLVVLRGTAFLIGYYGFEPIQNALSSSACKIHSFISRFFGW